MKNENTVPSTLFVNHAAVEGSRTKGQKIEILSSHSSKEIPLAARGFVELVDWLGDDLTVVNAARVSFGKEKSEFDANDAKLLKYLANHNHWTPYSQVMVQLRIKMPAFVARQYFKHQIGVTRNEISRRYVKNAPEFWVPYFFRESAENVKQGSANTVHPLNEEVIQSYVQACEDAKQLYEQMIIEGVCPEQARTILPLSMMVEFVETGSLATYHRICGLRAEKTAQREIQDYAIAIDTICSEQFPNAWLALKESRMKKDS